jgi:uncharacterized protein (UPF0332 family)
MSFNWRNYLNLARELSGKRVRPYNSQEAKARTAISRAYYAAFIEARNFLRDREGITAPANSHPHAFVINYFKRGGDLIRQNIGDDLDYLRSFRKLADYEDVLYRQPQRVQQSLDLADKVIQNLDRL